MDIFKEEHCLNMYDKISKHFGKNIDGIDFSTKYLI